MHIPQLVDYYLQLLTIQPALYPLVLSSTPQYSQYCCGITAVLRRGSAAEEDLELAKNATRSLIVFSLVKMQSHGGVMQLKNYFPEVLTASLGCGDFFSRRADKPFQRRHFPLCMHGCYKTRPLPE